MSAAQAPPVLSFVIVGPGDAPAYEADLALVSAAPSAATGGTRDERAAYLHSFIQNAALDAVDDAAWGSGGGGSGGATGAGAPYHGVVDRFNNLMVREERERETTRREGLRESGGGGRGEGGSQHVRA